MTHTGLASRTECNPARAGSHRPGPCLGRSRTRGWRRAFATGFIALFLLAPGVADAQFQELFSWWRRDLLPVSVQPGAWIELERTEISEGTKTVDTVRCTVLQPGPDDSLWLSVSASEADVTWYLQIDVRVLTANDGHLLGALRRLVSVEGRGAPVEEDLAELEKSRMVRRHLQDLFQDPVLTRFAAGDTTVADTSLTRERVVLTEVQDTRAKLGARTLVHTTNIRSTAELSAQVPVFGLLRSQTDILIESHFVEPDGTQTPGAPPLATLSSLRCLGFGFDGAARLPIALRSR